MKLHQFLEAVADLQVGGDKLVRQFRPAADDQEIALISHKTLDQIIVNPDHDHHIGAGTTRLVDLVGVDYDKFSGHQLVLAPLQMKGRVSVQNIDQFQRIVPVGRCVFPGCLIFHQDTVFGYIVVLKINIIGHIDSSHLFVPNLSFRIGKCKDYQNYHR